MLIQNAIIFDGTGAKNFVGDIRIQKNKIVKIGKLKPAGNEQVLNVKGSYVMPGFVDILNHSDAYMTLFSNPSQESLLRQGVTTILMGNCGSSLAPLVDGTFINSLQKWGDTSRVNVNWLSVAEYITELKKHSFGINIATLVGHSTIRRAIIDNEPRILTQVEMDQLAYMVERGLSEGAFGVSTGLVYTHARNASLKEIETLMEVASKNKALYATHIRDEGAEFFQSIQETVSIARHTGVNLEFSHLKVTGEEFWGQFDEALTLLREAPPTINFDIYPYRTTASVLYSFLPAWASEGGNASLLGNISNPNTRKQIILEMQQDAHDYASMIVAMGAIDKIYFGKNLQQLAQNQGVPPEEVALNMISASRNRIIVFTETISEENIIKAMQHPRSFISSDGAGYSRSDISRGEFVHPRYFGAFPKFFSAYVHGKNLLTWEAAIHKATFGPAQKIGLKKRGKIAKGYFADIVILHPGLLRDNATFINPYQYSRGIHYVIVNGEIAVEEGKLTGTLSGEVLKKV